MKKILIICIAFLGVWSVKAERVSVADFGLKPDTRENAVLCVQKAIEHCQGKKNVELFFPKGRYDFWPQHARERDYYESNTYDIFPKRLAILLEGLSGFTLNGDSSQFIMHDRIQPITVDNCSDITLKNFSIDWDIPLMAQGKIVRAQDGAVDVKIDQLESPFIIENDKLVFVGEGWKSSLTKLMEFSSEDRCIVPATGEYAIGKGWKEYTAQSLGNGVVRLTKPGGLLRLPAQGNMAVLRHSTRDHSGIFMCHTAGIKLRNIDVFQAGGLAVLAQYCTDLSFHQVNVVPSLEKGRYFSSHDDGFHLMGCKGQVSVDSCRWAGLMDDPINIHGTCVRIMEVISPQKIRCRFMENMSKGLIWGQSGDEIGVIENKSMRTVATNVLTAFRPINVYEFEIELSTPLPKGTIPGHVLENLTWTPAVDIRNSFFGSCRARGVLVSTPRKVVIENNVFESSGSAILIAGDANQWFETGAVKDVLIRGNDFRYPCNSSIYQFCEAIISIYPEIPEPNAQNPYHRNIRIVENRFNPFDYPILYAKSVDGLQFERNTIERSNKHQPSHYRKKNITLIKCKNISVKGNKLLGDVLGTEKGRLSIEK